MAGSAAAALNCAASAANPSPSIGVHLQPRRMVFSQSGRQLLAELRLKLGQQRQRFPLREAGLQVYQATRQADRLRENRCSFPYCARGALHDAHRRSAQPHPLALIRPRFVARREGTRHQTRATQTQPEGHHSASRCSQRGSRLTPPERQLLCRNWKPDFRTSAGPRDHRHHPLLREIHVQGSLSQAPRAAGHTALQWGTDSDAYSGQYRGGAAPPRRCHRRPLTRCRSLLLTALRSPRRSASTLATL